MWLELTTHVRVEHALRGIKEPPPSFLANAAIPRPTYPNEAPAAKAAKDSHIPESGTFYVKLGKREHMEALYEKGALRIAPAAYYSDPSLNLAVRDDELSLSLKVPRREVVLERLNKTTGTRTLYRPPSDLTITHTLKSNYYVYCVGSAFDLRLFGDFGYDACVLITDPREFFVRLNGTMANHLPGWQMLNNDVRYVDPYRPPTEPLTVFFEKHFRFWYQHEHRAVWLPPPHFAGEFAPLDVQIGSLKDVASLVVLEAN